MFDSSSRYRLVDQALQAPGRSLISRTTVGPFVDTGIELNKFDTLWAETNYARIYLSIDEIRELAEGAGLFDEIRENLIPNEVSAHLRGFNEGVNEHGDLAALVDRLELAVGRLRRGTGLSTPLVPAGEGDDVPAVHVSDGRPAVRNSGGDDTAAALDGADAGQGDGTGSDNRPALVPERPGDGDNPFRI